MKKQILLFFALFFVLGASAQTALGLKAGLNGSRLYTKDDKTPKTLLRTDVGLVCNFTYTKPVSFQMEVNYSRKGAKLITDDKLTYGYLEVPLLLKVAGGKEKLKVFGLLGPYIAAPLKEEYISGDNKTTASATENSVVDGNAVVEKIDVGFHLGGGVTYKLGPGRVLLEIRYCQGFGENFIDDSFNTSVFQVNTGYLFTFGD